MSQTSGHRSKCPVLLRRLNTGGDLSRPGDVNQSTDRSLMRSESLSKCQGHSFDLPCVQIRSCSRAGVPPAFDLGAHIKSP